MLREGRDQDWVAMGACCILDQTTETRSPLIFKGSKRSRWKAKFLEVLGKAAVDLGDIGHEDILQAVKRQRKAARSKPDNTVASEATSKRA